MRLASHTREIVTGAFHRAMARRIKQALYRLRWAMRPRSSDRPPIPANVRSVLFVCLGNICRSPFAALVAQRHLVERGVTRVVCTSAGLEPSNAAGSPPEACTASARYGVSLDGHRPRAITRALVDGADLIVVMERAHVDDLAKAYPDHHDRVVLLPLLDRTAQGHERYGIADPFGQRPEAYDRCYRRIDAAVGELIAEIVGRPAPSTPRNDRNR